MRSLTEDFKDLYLQRTFNFKLISVTTRRNSRRALIKSASISGSDSETTISCSASDISLYDLIWRFNHSQTILTKTRTETKHTVSEEWRQHVKSVSESGSLTLQHLSSNQEGLYTCELTNEEETITTNTFVRISPVDSHSVGGIIGSVFAAIVVTAPAVGLVMYCKKKRKELIKDRRMQRRGQPEHQQREN
ncbi:nectin-2-like isoform X2 [Parambassis ranga]|uniref:Nectin-2-like isoform X2 n=1 Tax=Parambassis ranga TaxID=210632 RepID=A0A6P7KFB2_9TELE|nr:nectin-2-like isoform X2 [Parambassis ranga]